MTPSAAQLLPLLVDAFSNLPIRGTLKSPVEIELDFAECEQTLRWKTQHFRLVNLSAFVRELPGAKIEASILTLSLEGVTADQTRRLVQRMTELAQILHWENLQSLDAWGIPDQLIPSGFKESDPSRSSEVLKHLYADDYIVKEKKAFVADLRKSYGGYLVSIDRKSIVDGAAQIASLSLGYNDPIKAPMTFRADALENSTTWSQERWQNWDIHRAFKKLLTEESHLPFCAFVNSGAEAWETCIRSLELKYPGRKRVIAFEGSFHGRSVLAVHATHSPSKRTPFEIHPTPELVDFAPFPEAREPQRNAIEPKSWLTLWDRAGHGEIPSELASLAGGSTDPLLASEVQALLKVREFALKAKPLAVAIEPMQCEGGDRYATARFFRALRVLTRALDVGLLFDEVQTGVGLGGGFFWHRCFHLETAVGTPDLPDAVCMAKKTQVGVALTAFPQAIPVETSPASMYRGYLQSQAVLQGSPADKEDLVVAYLNALGKTLGPELIQTPRHQGYAFSIDLPTKELADKLIAARFPAGTIFYPAGDKTLRFRLMTTATEREIHQIFIALYRCFIAVGAQGLIPNPPTLDQFLVHAPKGAKEAAQNFGTAPFTEKLPWPKGMVPRNKQEFLQIPDANWTEIFLGIIHHFPEILRSRSSMDWDLPRLSRETRENLWDRYERDPAFTLLDLLWTSSRAFAHRIERLTVEEVGALRPAIQKLEEALYEPERQDDPEMFYRVSRDPDTIFLASRDPRGELLGICAAAPLRLFPHVTLVDRDPAIQDAKALYSIDLSVHPSAQGKGLGMHFKCEQMIEAIRQGATLIRSRNRSPQAQTMMHINMRLGGVVIDSNDHDYGGEGMSVYQSITLPKRDAPFAPIALQGGLKNKGSLANFISPSYAAHLQFLRGFLPESHRHIYLASGRAEALDKALKLFRAKRPEAKMALSFEGDVFGWTTALSRSLGGRGGPRYFDRWPLLKAPDLRLSITDRMARIEKELASIDPKLIFAFFINPRSECGTRSYEPEFLAALISALKAREIPVVLHETGSAFYQYSSEHFSAAHALIARGITPDVIAFYAGAQLGVVATTREYFIEQALAMISTWDGDEWSLSLLRERLLSCAR